MMQLRFGPWEVGFNTPSQVSKFKSTSKGSARDPFMPTKTHIPKFSPLGFMGLVHEPFTYIFSNKINYLVEDFMSLEVLVVASLSCDQNLGKKDFYYP